MNINERVIEIITEKCDIDNIDEYLKNNDDLTPLSINSVSFIKLVVELENEFSIEFEDEALDYNKFKSLNSLCNYIKKMMKTETYDI